MRLHRQHAWMLARVADLRESAYRCRDREPERAEMLMDEANDTLRDANALRDVLADLGRVDDPRQMEMRA